MINSLFTMLPMDWVKYFLMYSSPGALLCIYLLADGWLKRSSDFEERLMWILGNETNFKEKLNEVFVIIFALLFALIAWPILLFWIIKEKRAETAVRAWQALPNFMCSNEYLTAKVTPTEAETMNIFTDPFGGVPAIPFGHLNKGWSNFLAKAVHQDDELWTFYIPKGSKAGKFKLATNAEIRGLAIIRDNVIISEFITESD